MIYERGCTDGPEEFVGLCYESIVNCTEVVTCYCNKDYCNTAATWRVAPTLTLVTSLLAVWDVLIPRL